MKPEIAIEFNWYFLGSEINYHGVAQQFEAIRRGWAWPLELGEEK